MYELVEFRHLRSFLTVAREGNFTRAADRLHLTQPALSTQIKQMEDGIPAQLFVREKTGVMLTPAGAALLGCQSKQAKTQDDLKKLEAEYAPLQAQYDKDCLSGSPEHIAANRSICEDERKKTADLDQRIAVLRQQAMQ